MYFFVEPNVVFVLKIETEHYVTVADVSDSGEWLTYDLNDGQEFESFYHEEHDPLVGRGYALRQDDINKMVEEINKQIQMHHRLNEKRTEPPCPIHLVCSESAAGSLRVALEWPKKVIGFPDFFCIGPLWKLHEIEGLHNRNEWLYEHINLEQDDFEYMNKFSNTLREIDDISGEVPIYIWFANNACEQTGLRFFLYLLRYKPNEIFLINSTEFLKEIPSSAHQSIFSTGQMVPEQFREIFAKCLSIKPLTTSERYQFEWEWERFAETTEVLRVYEKNEIVGVSEDFFDPLIVKTIEELHAKQETKDFIRVGEVIGEIIEQANEYLNIYYLEYRIRDLIYSGVLELRGIPKSMRHYRVKMR